MHSLRLFALRTVGQGSGQAGVDDALCYRTLPNYMNCSHRGEQRAHKRVHK